MVNEIHKKMGTIDILVNNAGILSAFSWDEFEDAKIKKIFDTNVMGSIYTTKECMDDLKKHQPGIFQNRGAGFLIPRRISGSYYN